MVRLVRLILQGRESREADAFRRGRFWDGVDQGLDQGLEGDIGAEVEEEGQDGGVIVGHGVEVIVGDVIEVTVVQEVDLEVAGLDQGQEIEDDLTAGHILDLTQGQDPDPIRDQEVDRDLEVDDNLTAW